MQGHYTLNHTLGYVQMLVVDLYLQLQLPGREAEDSPLSGIEVKNEWTHSLVHLYPFRA